MELYAGTLVLSPISGPVEAMDPPATDSYAVVRTDEGLGLQVEAGIDTVPATRDELS